MKRILEEQRSRILKTKQETEQPLQLSLFAEQELRHEERDSDILKLRELHAAMDKAVLEAYGWNGESNGDELYSMDYRPTSSSPKRTATSQSRD